VHEEKKEKVFKRHPNLHC